MKKSKRIISMILAVIMLSMTAIGVNAEELIVGFDDLLEAIGIIEHDHEEELMAMAAGDECTPHICNVKIRITYTWPDTERCSCGGRFYNVHVGCNGCDYGYGYNKVCLFCADLPDNIKPFPGG